MKEFFLLLAWFGRKYVLILFFSMFLIPFLILLFFVDVSGFPLFKYLTYIEIKFILSFFIFLLFFFLFLFLLYLYEDKEKNWRIAIDIAKKFKEKNIRFNTEIEQEMVYAYKLKNPQFLNALISIYQDLVSEEKELEQMQKELSSLPNRIEEKENSINLLYEKLSRH
ncbi:hypothetical protein KKA23_01165 [Patescibacteria group bacterium]|nr:hypothetical protein [Patescibacteria group bacterium]